MGLHVFWDNSNVWGAANNLREIKEPGVPWMALRVYFRNLYQLATKERPVLTKIMSGSVPPECEELWEYARQLGFETNLLRRVESSPGEWHEQAVDEVLHLKMGNVVLDYDLPQTMALLSGDSRDSQYGTSFPSQVRRALKNGWDVEIYSASMCIGSRKYAPLKEEFGNRLSIIHLDGFYEMFTFVKGGEYYRKDEHGDRIYFTVPERVVQPLRY